jgi:hypothetical protein
MADYYGEISPPNKVQDIKDLRYYAQILVNNHLAKARKLPEYHGLCESVTALERSLVELKDQGYIPKAIRKSCISGIIVKSLSDNPIDVVNITLTDRSGEDSYLHLVVIDQYSDVIDKIKQLIDKLYGKQNWWFKNPVNECHTCRPIES